MKKIIEVKRNIVKVNNDYTLKIADQFERMRPKRLLVEAFALKRASQLGICVPRVISYGTFVDGREYLKLETIKGNKVSSKKLPISTFDVYKNIGKQFRDMPLTFSSFGWINPYTMHGEFASWKMYLLNFVEKYGVRLVTKKILEKDHVYKILNHIKTMEDTIKKSGLIHGDLISKNLIYDYGAKKVFIIDWEYVVLGDPLFDLAMLRTRCGDSVTYRGFLDGFRGAPLNSREKYLTNLYSIIISIGVLNYNLRNNFPLSGLKKLEKQIKEFDS